MSRNDASLFEGNIGSWVEMLSTNVLGTCMMTRAVVQVGHGGAGGAAIEHVSCQEERRGSKRVSPRFVALDEQAPQIPYVPSDNCMAARKHDDR